nr:PREDICTED: type II inositol 3,4-bisphosphate 4-phosphatase isoform X11 [Latimeria chalumnae]|eukprot:XP_006010062.2 PREDICTED: type II inositol 3,4-bisphosphate 4-phosphatase isoform X11 [Latimeria chalumnae]
MRQFLCCLRGEHYVLQLEKTQQSQTWKAVTRSFLGCSTFQVSDLLKSKEQQLTLTLRTLDGVDKAGIIDVSLVKMGEIEEGEADHIRTDVQGQQCTLVCECSSAGTTNEKDNCPLINTVFKNPVWKIYRFPTTDNKWLYVREQMTESTLSFHIPKELIALYIIEDTRRIQELQELGDLSPHWNNLRESVITHYEQLVSSYKDTLTELNKLSGSSFKPSCSKGEKTLEFIPINLHLQRMHVHSPSKKASSANPQDYCRGPSDITYDVITVGSPAAHFQGFKNGGLRRLLNKFEIEKKNTGYQCIYYSPENTAKAKEVLSNINHLQPLISSHADLLLNSAQQRSSDSLKNSLKMLSEKDRVWANVGKSLNCIIAMVDRLLEQDNNKEGEIDPTLADLITSHTSGDWYEQLYPLIVTLKDCVTEVVERARKSMAFVLLQEAACSMPQGLPLNQRRDMVFSQALAGLVCGFVIKLCTSLHDKGFLQQLHSVGLLAQYEGLLSTYSEEIGMLEDMVVGISDLQQVTFKIVEAKSDDLLPVVNGRRSCYTVEVKLPAQMFELLPQEIKEGKLLHIYPVLFNIGINEQQTLAERFGDISLQEKINQESFELLKEYFKALTEKLPLDCLPQIPAQTDLKELLENLHQNIQAKKRKNVEILWLAATICRRLNGIRFTSCKSAKDRTSMSVTLEQCSILRDEHDLSKDYFMRALDCMRREGCRIENAQKNVKCRKYAFNMIQLMAFPKYYRPPEGTYGKADT